MVLPHGAPGVQVMVQEWAASRPDEPAVRDSGTGATLSYRQLWERSTWLAAELAGRGVRRGDVVAVALDRSIELVVAMVGIVRAGAAYLPLDGQAPPDRIATILADAGAGFVVGTPPDGTAPADPRIGRVTVPTTAPAGGAAPPDVPVGGDDPCYVMYTSGSTGTPKGVVVPHRAVVRLVARPHYCVVPPGDRCANQSNPAFDATTFEVWGALAAGATVVVLPSVLSVTIDDWVALLRRERIDTLFLTTSLFHTVAREEPAAFGSLANLVVGGEQLELTVVRRVLAAGPPRRLVNGYGPTETTTFAAYFDCTADSLAGLDRVPIGYPLQDTGLYVLDEALRPVPPGDVGELCIGGPGVALGYLGLPELTAERFVTEPRSGERLYRTGDLARMLPSGAIELRGRRDRQVKLRGFRIELEEIEQATMATGRCDAAFVEKVGEGPAASLVAFVLPARGSAGDGLTELLAGCLAERLPAYMVPARWVVLDGLRFGPTGKVDREQLLSLLDDASGQASAAGGDLGPVGEAIQQVWQEVLEVPRVSPGDGFLDLGGNSVMAVQVAIRLQQRLGLPVEPADILLAESLADLAGRASTAVAARS
ncbi:MAG TPA: non-ribosomal peptide synthetase [Micromonosporaceae bacterium]|nr:non-ribosomal peptide synthetase [Micromonosporaceae bacterium]